MAAILSGVVVEATNLFVPHLGGAPGVRRNGGQRDYIVSDIGLGYRFTAGWSPNGNRIAAAKRWLPNGRPSGS